jgi:hypothetical protein
MERREYIALAAYSAGNDSKKVHRPLTDGAAIASRAA